MSTKASSFNKCPLYNNTTYLQVRVPRFSACHLSFVLCVRSLAHVSSVFEVGLMSASYLNRRRLHPSFFISYNLRVSRLKVVRKSRFVTSLSSFKLS